jgi:hypothetical protein
MNAVIGLRKDRRDLPATEMYVRELRRNRALKRIAS